ncbi:ribosomal protein S18-alanine N-acetyltransferase [Microbulbifer sp. EKSA008]|uniref:ribosomal protein S18-alanine N-acetyltransferase n=1 Tax=Microbulbifer sp. EKSA008 TaxID=3243367 RepID=UPI004042FDA5
MTYLNYTELQLRSADADDCASLAQLAKSAHSHPWSQAQYQQSLSAGHYCWVLIQGDDIIACCVISSLFDQAEILDIAVSPARRRQGLAEALLNSVKTELPCEVERILLEVRVSNLAARSLYRKLGFSEDGIRKSYYPAQNGMREDAVLMSLALNDTQS